MEQGEGEGRGRKGRSRGKEKGRYNRNNTSYCPFVCCKKISFDNLNFDYFQTPEEFWQNYTTLLKMEPYKSQNLSEFIISGSEFDATWAMALGLQTASERVRRNDSQGCDHLPGRLVPLEEMDYMNQRMGCVLRDSFQHVSFPGVTVSRCH